MELHQLRYFVEVSRRRNFTRAAQACRVAQPSLSQQIIKLEKELGQPLLDRTRRKILLTPAGQRFLPQAQAILAAVEDARRMVSLDDALHGQLSIGAISTIAPYLLPQILARFLHSRPQATVSVVENLTPVLVEACLAGELDAAIVALPINEPMLEAVPLFTESLLLATAYEHPLARQRSVKLTDLTGHPFVLLDPVHCLGAQIVQFCRDRSCVPVVRCRSSQLLTVQKMVAMGLGLSLIPQMACTTDAASGCRYRRLSGDHPQRTIGLVYLRRRFRTPLLEHLLAILRADALQKKRLATSGPARESK